MVDKDLTKAEEQVMQVLWILERGFLKEIVAKFPEPKPAYTTVSTVIRVLVKKGFIGFNAYGKTNQYFPLVSKAAYFQSRLKPKLSTYFNGLPSAFASFFANEKFTLSELEEIRQLIDGKIKKLKGKKSNTLSRK